MRAVTTSWAVGLLVGSLICHADDFDPADDIEGSAYLGEWPVAAEEAFHRALVDAAAQYVECLSSESDSFFLQPDYATCDPKRDGYSALLPADDFATIALGCLEERAIGAPRVEGKTCAELYKLAAAQPSGRAREER